MILKKLNMLEYSYYFCEIVRDSLFFPCHITFLLNKYGYSHTIETFDARCRNNANNN